jgi:hypothetical protein
MMNNRISEYFEEQAPPAAPPMNTGAFVVFPLAMNAGPSMQQFYAAAFEQARKAAEAQRPSTFNLECWN